jgi:hypothetical protein
MAKAAGRYKYNYEADELSDIEDDLDSEAELKQQPNLV